MKRYKGIATLEILEEAKNYNQWIAKQFLPHIKTPLLEVGSGTGNLSAFFINKKNVTLSDVDKKLVAILQKKFNKTNIVHMDIAGKKSKQYLERYNSIIAINVLEHIANHKKALQNIYSFLRKNGTLLVLVPAKKSAYTRLDKSIGHQRRYEKEELQKILKETNFEVQSLYFFNIVGLLSWIIRDKIERSHQMKPYQIRIFDKIVPLLERTEKLLRPPLGVSLIAIAKKK